MPPLAELLGSHSAFEALGGMSEATTTSLSRIGRLLGLRLGVSPADSIRHLFQASAALSLSGVGMPLSGSIDSLLAELFNQSVVFFVLFCFVFSSVLYCVLCSFFLLLFFFLLSNCVSVLAVPRMRSSPRVQYTMALPHCAYCT